MIIANPILSGSVNISGSLNVNGESIGATSVSSSLATVAERVRAGDSGSRDTSTPQSGSLWFNTNTATLEVYSGASGSGWESVGSSTSAGPYLADFLVVAGGGGAGNGGTWHESGGGGAGGLRTSYGSTSGGGVSNETSLEFTPGIVYTITVGGGGAARTAGQDSQLSGTGITTITSNGGGYGGDNLGSIRNPGSGGSGAGGSYNVTPGGSGTAGQGYDGGAGKTSSGPNNGGGGGGAAQDGINGDAASNRAYGGNGLAVNILSTANATTSAVGEVSSPNVYFAGGGAGGAANGESSTRLGGLGGGGDAPVLAATGGAGTANTGGGGGGCANSTGTGGAGGSGVVILRMATSNYSGTYTGTSVDVYTEGSDTVIVFKDSGTYTA